MGEHGERAYTKKELLAALRRLEALLHSPKVVGRARRLPADELQRFAAARLHLGALITRLGAARMRDIRRRVERQSASLRRGVAAAETALARLDAASRWAPAIQRLLVLLGRVVPLL